MKKFSFSDALKNKNNTDNIQNSDNTNNNISIFKIKNENITVVPEVTKDIVNSGGGYILKNVDEEFDDLYANNIIDLKFDFNAYLKYEFINNKYFQYENNSIYNFENLIKLSSNNYQSVINSVEKYNNECKEEEYIENEKYNKTFYINGEEVENVDDALVNFYEGTFG